MTGKVILVVAWFPLTIVLLIINLALLASTVKTASKANAELRSPVITSQITATAGTAQILGTNVIAGDARSLLLGNYLKDYGSPMAPFADLMVREADANGLDFRLLVAIAMCESNLGKKIPSRDSYNPFGIAVYTGSQSGKKFASWEDAIIWVSNYIKTFYFDRGITNLRDIGAIWAPPTEADGHAWSACVSGFQKSIF